MKKIMFFIFCLFAVLFISCTSKVAPNVNNFSPIALICVATNDEVTILDDPEDGTGIFSQYLNKIKEDENPISAKNIGILVDEKINEIIYKNPQILSKDTVTNVPAYTKQKASSFKNLNHYIAAPGYKMFVENDTQKIAYILKETNAKTAMYLIFKFHKAFLNAGTDQTSGDMHGIVRLEASVRNLAGKQIFKKNYESWSDEYFTTHNTFLTYDERYEIASYYPYLVDNVLSEFCTDFNLQK